MEVSVQNQKIIILLGLFIICVSVFAVCASDHIPGKGLAPEAPTDLVGGAYSSSVIILNWMDNSDNELGFYIYRADSNWVRVGNVAEDVTEWADYGLDDSTLYRYYVEAIGQSQNSEKSNVISVYTRAIGNPPDIPHNPLPFNGIDTTVAELQLSWECSDPDSDFLTYDLYYGPASPPILRSADLTVPTYLIQHVQPDTVLYWQVVAKDGYHHEVAGPIWYFRNSNQ
jgi:hypothetical protein